jgi:hypothetical protein
MCHFLAVLVLKKNDFKGGKDTSREKNSGFPSLILLIKNLCNRPARAVQLTGTRGTLADSADSMRI